jgi:hypothetical protein
MEVSTMQLFKCKAPSVGLVVFTITGCQNVTPIASPTPTEVTQEASALSQTGLKPADYMAVGYGLVEKECGIFFDSLDKAQDQASFIRQELTLGAAAAAGILAVVRAGIVPITITGIAVPLAANTVGNYQNILLITPYPDETGILVRSALKTYRENASVPTNIYDAVALVQGYAAICTYSGIHQLAKQALATAQTTDQSKPTAGSPGAAPAPPPPPPPPFGGRPPEGAGRVHIPNVVVR